MQDVALEEVLAEAQAAEADEDGQTNTSSEYDSNGSIQRRYTCHEEIERGPLGKAR